MKVRFFVSRWKFHSVRKMKTPKAGVFTAGEFFPSSPGKTASPPWNLSRIQDETGKRIVTKSRTLVGVERFLFRCKRGSKLLLKTMICIGNQTAWWCLGACEHWTRRPGHIRETRRLELLRHWRDIQPRLPIWTVCSLISMSSFNLRRWE